MAIYTYDLLTDFPNQAVDPSVLSVEIEDSSITTPFDGVTVNGDNVDIIFTGDLTVGEKTTLDNIVANHQGIPFNNGAQRINVIAAQDNATNTWEDAAQLVTEPVGVQQYTLAFYCELRTSTDGNNNSQSQFQLLLDGSEVASGGTRGVEFFDARSGSLVISTNRGSAPVITLQWRQNGSSATAQIRRCRLALVPLFDEGGE